MLMTSRKTSEKRETVHFNFHILWKKSRLQKLNFADISV